MYWVNIYIYTYTHYASLLAALRADFPNFIMFDILNISKKIKCLLHFIIMSDCTLLRNYQIYLAFFRWMQDETRKSWGACEDHHCKSRTCRQEVSDWKKHSLIHHVVLIGFATMFDWKNVFHSFHSLITIQSPLGVYTQCIPTTYHMFRHTHKYHIDYRIL